MNDLNDSIRAASSQWSAPMKMNTVGYGSLLRLSPATQKLDDLFESDYRRCRECGLDWMYDKNDRVFAWTQPMISPAEAFIASDVNTQAVSSAKVLPDWVLLGELKERQLVPFVSPTKNTAHAVILAQMLPERVLLAELQRRQIISFQSRSN